MIVGHIIAKPCKVVSNEILQYKIPSTNEIVQQKYYHQVKYDNKKNYDNKKYHHQMQYFRSTGNIYFVCGTIAGIDSNFVIVGTDTGACTGTDDNYFVYGTGSSFVCGRRTFCLQYR